MKNLLHILLAVLLTGGIALILLRVFTALKALRATGNSEDPSEPEAPALPVWVPFLILGLAAAGIYFAILQLPI